MMRGVLMGGRSVLLALGMGMVIGGHYQWYVRPQLEQLRALTPQVVGLRSRLADVQQTLSGFDAVSDRVVVLERRWQDMEDRLVEGGEIPAVLDRLSREAEASGWQIHGIRPLLASSAAAGRRHDAARPFTVVITGTGEEQAAAAWVRQIEHDPHTLSVSQLQLRSVAGESGRVRGRVAVTLYVAGTSS